MKITLQQLKDKGACSSQVARFAELFGESVEVTEELCIKHASDFDFDWAAQHLLSAPARAEYRRVRDAARAEYERVAAESWAEYRRVRDSAFARAAMEQGE